LKLEVGYVALGANLGQAEETVLAAVEELAMLPNTRLGAVSSLYRTAPVGNVNQPDFVNAVARIETALAPRELLDALLEIERRYKRVRGLPNAPRTLDLDLLLYGDRVVDEPGLTVPHPRMHERAFVMTPLAEIAPDAQVPGRGRAGDLAQALPVEGVSKMPTRPQ
jgi:2-amino-4-hydroxy-6-hydroxymethyldihydropteridine diphosphokinase